MSKELTYVEIDIPTFTDQILLNFEETNSPPIINDLGGHTWTLNGNAFIDTSDKKFGNSSLKLDGTGDYISAPDSADFSIGDADFTIDFWFNRTGGDGTIRRAAGQDSGGGTNRSFQMGLIQTNIFFGEVGIGANNFFVGSTTTFTSSGWHHVAFVRTNGTLKLFLDGIQEGGNLAASGYINDSPAVFAVGAGDVGGSWWLGSIDAFRFTNGTARWISNFTPPAAATTSIITTYRFAVDASYLPSNIDCIPSIKTVEITPSLISLGTDLGQRASVTVTFKDHKHVFASESFDSGTFWGKFRARYGLRLTGYNLRVIRGELGDEFSNMETRHFIIESVTGPSAKGEYKIIAKDILKLADGDRSLAPVPSNGFTSASVTSGATSFTLQPSGIGNSEYPASGYVNIGGKEVCSFTRSGDTMTITRAQYNTTAVAHDASERAQLCLRYNVQDVADIIYDLLVTYAGVDSTQIPLSTWHTETATYLNTSYSALIAEPTSVNKLISELVEQAGLAVWWGDISQQVHLQVLRPVDSDAATFDADTYLANSLEVNEQPDKRLSQVYTYFAKLSPLVNEDQVNNYRSTAYKIDAEAEARYGGIPAIKKIYSRWIPDGGRAIADTLNSILLARFRDPPRRISMDVLRSLDDQTLNPFLGVGYQIQAWPFQDLHGNAVQVPAQITRLNPKADVFEIELEEMSASAFSTGAASPDVHTVIIDSNRGNVNLRTLHDSIYGVPTSGTTISCIISSGIIVSASSTSVFAFDTGTWPAGITIQITNNGRIAAAGGKGGIGRTLGWAVGTGLPGSSGGTAMRVRQAITLTTSAGAIWGGGGGGGGASAPAFNNNGCGGGGAGQVAGVHGDGQEPPHEVYTVHGTNGTATAGGAGGAPSSGYFGGGGGGPGVAGQASFTGEAGGAAGFSVNGNSNVTYVGGTGDRRGPTTG